MIYIITDEIKDLITELENQIPNQKFLFYSSKTNGYVTPNTVSSYFAKIKKDLELKTLSHINFVIHMLLCLLITELT